MMWPGPVVFDWERVSQENSRTLDTSGDAITNATIAFCREVEEAGYLPMVYFSPSKGYTELELERLLDWPFWLAHYTEDWSGHQLPLPLRHVAIHQLRHCGRHFHQCGSEFVPDGF